MSFKLFFQAVQARTYPRIAWLFRSNSWMIQETVLPVLAVSAFAYAYRAMEAPAAYTGFLVLGAAMTTFWLNVLWGMGAQLYWERDSGNLELYVMSPAPMTAILTGMAIGGMITTVIRATAITVAGVFLFDVPINPSSWWLLVLGFVVTLAALYGLVFKRQCKKSRIHHSGGGGRSIGHGEFTGSVWIGCGRFKSGGCF